MIYQLFVEKKVVPYKIKQLSFQSMKITLSYVWKKKLNIIRTRQNDSYKKTLKDTAKFTRQVQTWAASDENEPHAAQTPKTNVAKLPVFRLFYQKEQKGQK